MTHEGIQQDQNQGPEAPLPATPNVGPHNTQIVEPYVHSFLPQGERGIGTIETPTATVRSFETSEGVKVPREHSTETAAEFHRRAGVAQGYEAEKPSFDKSALSAQDQRHYDRGERRIRREAEKHAGHAGSGKGESARRATNVYNTVQWNIRDPHEVIARGKVPVHKLAGQALKGIVGR